MTPPASAQIIVYFARPTAMAPIRPTSARPGTRPRPAPEHRDLAHVGQVEEAGGRRTAVCSARSEP